MNETRFLSYCSFIVGSFVWMQMGPEWPRLVRVLGMVAIFSISFGLSSLLSR